MKKIIQLTLIVMCLFVQQSWSQIQMLKKTSSVENKEIKTAKKEVKIQQEVQTLPKDQLKSIKETYNWTKEEILVINFKGLKDECPFSIYDGLQATQDWFDNEVYPNVDLTNCRNIYIYADKLYAKPILDFETHYDDVGHYFLKHFFNRKGTCYGVMVINKKGEYLVEGGEYNQYTITNMIQRLK
ncbi:hypothetical protein NHF50_13715 [Flavobacterium sp. NRK F10]|uniref:Uncharacterized protein n=1 Tax=Flavobacterium sediminis TaxID=2201181 RepID=A0A2U8QXB5_9FLAO|nr:MULTISPECIES: hypothetical protein [Flavobacterium]AWM14862.1 hypothetical protein DI487_14030 [Flavobacterium sediminis]MCO6176104.1 hypothetical protein [Flavobacterium sp. NRK F10]